MQLRNLGQVLVSLTLNKTDAKLFNELELEASVHKKLKVLEKNVQRKDFCSENCSLLRIWSKHRCQNVDALYKYFLNNQIKQFDRTEETLPLYLASLW